MEKKIAIGLVAGVMAGIVIYLTGRVMKEKKSNRQKDKDRSARAKRIYAYEYTL